MHLAHNGYIYCEIWNRMYVLLQAVILANHQIFQRLEPKSYAPCKHTPVLQRHKLRPIIFSFFYDDFGVKYVGKQHAYYLINNIQEHYQVSIDWEGKRYSGIIIKFKYQNKQSIYPCPVISKRHCTGSYTVHQQENNIHHISGNDLIMEKLSNSPRQSTHLKNFPQNEY